MIVTKLWSWWAGQGVIQVLDKVLDDTNRLPLHLGLKPLDVCLSLHFIDGMKGTRFNRSHSRHRISWMIMKSVVTYLPLYTCYCWWPWLSWCRCWFRPRDDDDLKMKQATPAKLNNDYYTISLLLLLLLFLLSSAPNEEKAGKKRSSVRMIFSSFAFEAEKVLVSAVLSFTRESLLLFFFFFFFFTQRKKRRENERILLLNDSIYSRLWGRKRWDYEASYFQTNTWINGSIFNSSF